MLTSQFGELLLGSELSGWKRSRLPFSGLQAAVEGEIQLWNSHIQLLIVLVLQEVQVVLGLDP